MVIKIFKYTAVSIIFSLSVIILLNNYIINNEHDLSDAQKYLKHNIVDHKINDDQVNSINFNFKFKTFKYKNSASNIVNSNYEYNYILILNSLSDYNNSTKFYPKEKLFSADGFKTSHFYPPIYTL